MFKYFWIAIWCVVAKWKSSQWEQSRNNWCGKMCNEISESSVTAERNCAKFCYNWDELCGMPPNWTIQSRGCEPTPGTSMLCGGCAESVQCFHRNQMRRHDCKGCLFFIDVDEVIVMVTGQWSLQGQVYACQLSVAGSPFSVAGSPQLSELSLAGSP